MLINLHKPNLDKAKIKFGEIDSLNPFERKLEYSCPSRGGWTIAHTPMIIPGAHMIYIGASACLRGVVLSAAEYEGLDRFSMVTIEEKDILSGQMEELFIEGVTDILNKLERKPTCVLPFTGCIHYFLATDIEYIYQELSARFPDIDFISAQMTPTMKINDHTPEEDMCRSIYLCLDMLPKNNNVVNFIGDSRYISPTGSHYQFLKKNGFKINDLAAIYDYADYKKMGEAALNIYSLPIAAWAAESLKDRLGQDNLYMPYTYNFHEIDRDMKALANKLSDLKSTAYNNIGMFKYSDSEEQGTQGSQSRPPAPDLETYLENEQKFAINALEKAKSIIGNTPISIDYMTTPRFLSLSRLLLEQGFNVKEVYGDNFSADSKPDLVWLRENYPELPFIATNDFRARFYDREHSKSNKILALGPKAAYFTGTNHFVNMIANNGWYGYDAVKNLAAAMIVAFENEKDTKSIIQVKAWGCSA